MSVNAAITVSTAPVSTSARNSSMLSTLRNLSHRVRSPVRVIAPSYEPVDDASVTRRAWLILVVGVLLAGATGGFALANRGESAVFTPTASWNMFPPAQWQSLRTKAGSRGFAPATLHVVAASSKADGTPLAILAGRKTGRMCFAVVTGHALGRTICKLGKPLLVFAFRDRYGNRPAIDVLGLARRDVQSVAAEGVMNGRPWVAGVTLMPLPGAFAFAGGTSGPKPVYVGRGASGRVLTRVHVAP